MCSDCPGWDECSNCTIERGDLTSTCATPLEHTTATEPGTALETLDIDQGYWRVTNTSDNVLACYNPDACIGGQTGAGGFCAQGYKGPCKGVRKKTHAWYLPCFESNLPSLIHIS